MNRTMLLRSALVRCWRFRSGTLLMGLGIMIAVTSAVLLQSVAGSVKARFHDFVERAYPADALVVMGGSGPMGGGGAGRKSVRLADVETVVRSMGIGEWDPLLAIGGRDISRGGTTIEAVIAGHSEKAESVRGFVVEEGEFLSAADVEGRAAVAVLGKTVARRLFGSEPAPGAQIFIDGSPFAVKGVLAPMGVDVHGGDQDSVVVVPYTTAMEKIARIDYLSAVTLRIGDRGGAAAARSEVLRIMRERHQIAPGQKDDFSVFTSDLMNEMVGHFFRTFDIFVPLIAVTAFAIAGLVILAIMQVNVRGRKHEIGLRRAVGARARDVERQIVIEVVLVSVVAAFVGLVLARAGIVLLAPVLAARMGVREVPMPLLAALVAVAGAVAAGVAGAVLPARRAAALDPVDALR